MMPKRDLRGGVLPGFIDTHILSAVRILGCLGYGLLSGCSASPCPRKRNSSISTTRVIAAEFVEALAAHGTTTAVFGSHFATTAAFQAANTPACIVAGMVLSDRLRAAPPAGPCLPRKHASYQFHGAGRMLYGDAALPFPARMRCSKSAARCCANPGVRADSPQRIAARSEIARLFPRDADYLAVYERHGLAGRHSVFAHGVQTTDAEPIVWRRGAAVRRTVPAATLPSAAAFFDAPPPARGAISPSAPTSAAASVSHVEGRPACLPESDGFSRRGAPATWRPWPAPGLRSERETGDFTAGKSADIVYLRAGAQSARRRHPARGRGTSARPSSRSQTLPSSRSGGSAREKMTLAEVNALPRNEFTAAFGWIRSRPGWPNRRGRTARSPPRCAPRHGAGSQRGNART